MPIFALRKIEAVKGKQQFDELIIDGVPQLESYENSLQPIYKKNIQSIYYYMNHVANLQSLPKEKFKDITPEGEVDKEYEFKSGDLRVYAIKKLNGKVIVFCGHKNSQDQDIRRFRSIKKTFIASL